jgi:uncharacterized beta-barrel protein YwiB (DUF1934 family)
MGNYTISIKGSQTSPGEEEECFELVTDGQYSRKNGVSKITYQESGVTGFEGMETSFLVEPERITLRRDSWWGGDMIFEEEHKHHFLYETPYGSLTMGIDTERIVHDIDEHGGSLHIQYVIDVENVIVSRNDFKISIKPS